MWQFFISTRLWRQICFHILLLLHWISSAEQIPGNADSPIYHNHFAVHIKGGDDHAKAVATEHGFINRGKIGTFLEDHYIFEHAEVSARSSNISHAHHVKLGDDQRVHWFEQQVERKRVKRDLGAEDLQMRSGTLYFRPPSDPLFHSQWFLNHGAADGSDMNVVPAWAKGYTGRGVVVTILDDGIQTNHPDLMLNYDPKASTDINSNDDDPMPQDNNDNKHGTRCAGEVAAQAYNEYCGVGIAFNASIGGVRMLDGMVNDGVEAKALSLNPNHIDIYSASWGPEDDGKTVDGPGPLAKKAFINGVKMGRNGRGSIFVWASGNGGRKVDNCNCDGYTNSIFTLSISSASQGGRKPWYLEECSSTLSTTYSSGTPAHDASITTVDQDGRLRPEKLCTNLHTGTSASAPIAAGVVALALEANPNLTWRDMQHLVVLTSNPNPLLTESGWLTNGVGRKFSHKFGYGLMDADAMVDVAKAWMGSGQQVICETETINSNVEIPSSASELVRVYADTDGCRGKPKEIHYLEHVQCKISLHYNPRGALHIVLTSPMGTKSSLLLPRPRDITNSGFEDWPFLSVHFWGEPANGTWTLEVNRSPLGKGARNGKGILKKWKLMFYGTKHNPLQGDKLLSEGSNARGTTKEEGQRERDKALIGRKESFSEQGQKKNGGSMSSTSELATREGEKKKSGTQKSPLSGGCHSQCKDELCDGPEANQCKSCKNLKLFKIGTCVEECPLNFYQTEDEPVCSLCHQMCDSCFGPNSNQCLSCSPEGFFFLADRSTCVLDDGRGCPLGYRLKGRRSRESLKEDSSSYVLNECTPCPEQCESCALESDFDNEGDDDEDGVAAEETGAPVVCLSCRENLALVDGRTCAAHCPAGFFLNSQTRICDRCDPKCATCTGPLATQCSLCSPGTFYFERKCVRACPTGFHPDEFHQECVPCPQGCASCTTADDREHHKAKPCSSCLPGWEYDKVAELCIPIDNLKCAAGSYGDASGTCRPCNEACASCHDGSRNCLSCHAGNLLHLSSCVSGSHCPISTFHAPETKECRHCPHACSECSSFSRCSKCVDGYGLTRDGKCRANCLDNEFLSTSKELTSRSKSTEDGQCQGCHKSCATCRGPSSNQCLSCHEGRYMLGGECVERCAGGYYPTAEGCQACHGACLACFGPEANQCSSCAPGLRLVGDTCKSCGLGKFHDLGARKCAACHDTCSSCSGPKATDCTGCHAPSVLDVWKRTCVPCCGTQRIREETEVENGQCCQCSEGRDRCSQPSQSVSSSEDEGANPGRKRSSFHLGIGDNESLLNQSSRSALLYFVLISAVVLASLVGMVTFRKGKRSIRKMKRKTLKGKRRRQGDSRAAGNGNGTNPDYKILLDNDDEYVDDGDELELDDIGATETQRLFVDEDEGHSLGNGREVHQSSTLRKASKSSHDRIL